MNQKSLGGKSLVKFINPDGIKQSNKISSVINQHCQPNCLQKIVIRIFFRKIKRVVQFWVLLLLGFGARGKIKWLLRPADFFL